jgi:hypothetical protein
VIYQGNNRDVSDDLKKNFGINYTVKSNENLWEYVWKRRERLYDNVTAAVAEKDGLMKTLGKPGSATHIPEKQIKEENKTPNNKAVFAIAFGKLVDEVHQYYALLKKTVNEINELKASQGPAAGASNVEEPVVGLLQPEASTEPLWKKMATDMQKALGKWYNATGNNAEAIDNLVKFDAEVRGVLGNRPFNELMNRLRALSAFEDAVTREDLKDKDLGEWTTAPHHEAAKKRIHELCELETALQKDYVWDIKDVIDNITKMKAVSEDYERQLTEINVTMQECKKFESDVITHLQNCPKEEVLTRIEFQRDETLYLAAWAAEYERLLTMKKHFHKELNVQSDVESMNELEIQGVLDTKIKILTEISKEFTDIELEDMQKDSCRCNTDTYQKR